MAFFLLMFARIMISSLNPAWSLTIFNASAYSMTVMSVISLIFIPLVLAYEGWSYYIFRKRLRTNKEHLVY